MKIYLNFPYFRRVNGMTLYRTSNPVYSFEFTFSKCFNFNYFKILKSSIGAMGGSNTNDTFRVVVLGYVILKVYRDTHVSFKEVLWIGTEKNSKSDTLFEEYGNDDVPKWQRKLFRMRSLAYNAQQD